MTSTFTLEWLLQVAVRRNLLDEVTARDVVVRAPEQRARLQRDRRDGGVLAGVSPPEVLVSLEVKDKLGAPLDADRLAAMVATESGLPYKKIDPLELDMGLVSAVVSRPFALRHVVLPLRIEGGRLVVAVENPFDEEVAFELGRSWKAGLVRVVASRADILKAITEVYGFKKSLDSAAREVRADAALSDFEQLVRLRTVGEIDATDQHVVNAVDMLLRYAFEQRASDIHLEPKREDALVRLRIDGVLHAVHTVPKLVYPAIASRLKTLARMDIAEKRRPQDGRIKTQLQESAVELRVSTLPVAFGEKIVIRIFDPDSQLRDLPSLGFEGRDLETWQRWMQAPHGLVLVTGPTGSGKTTTLYASLKALSADDVNVVSVEDPIEMVTDRFNQVAVQPKIDLGFASALRTILRQDPDIIMVGEIRDNDTAEMAVQAALTGHLVLSTLHTNDSVGAVTRLRDLGVAPFLIGSTLVGVMAQRLVRRVCKDCAAPAPLSAEACAAVGITDVQRYQGTQVGKGCPSCRNTGYRGRVGIFETFDGNREMQKLVQSGAGEDLIRQAAQKSGMRRLHAAALERLQAGLTTVAEVLRVVGGSD